MSLSNSLNEFINYDFNMLKTPDIQNLKNINGLSSSDIGEKADFKKNSFNKDSSTSRQMMLSDLGIEKSNYEISKVINNSEDCKNSQPQSSKEDKKQTKKRRRHKDNVGPWKLGKTLGKGSSGRVRLAKNQKTGQLAAVKIVRKGKSVIHKKQETEKDTSLSGTSNDTYTEFFEEGVVPYGIEREIIIMKLVNHANIMGLYEVWENKNELYLVLEYVNGGELFDHLVSNGKFLEPEAVYYLKQIVQGVSYLHKFNICHRDLKPENILLDKKNQKIKIADFGMAALELSDKLLKTSCGSPHYASPEIIKGKEYNGSPSDVWSCGIILFALLAGHLPFNDSDIKKLLLKVQIGKYEFPSHFSPEARDLIDRMLQTNPNDRIAIDEIMNHPLLLKYSKTTKNKSNTNINNLLKNQDVIHIKENNLFPTLPVTPDKVNFVTKDDIDQNILESLQVLWHGISVDILIEKLLRKEQNEEKIFYSLLYQYQSNQHNFGNSEEALIEKEKNEHDKTTVYDHDNICETPPAPKLDPTSRFSSFLSFQKLQFPTSDNLSKRNKLKESPDKTENNPIEDSKPGLGLFLSKKPSDEQSQKGLSNSKNAVSSSPNKLNNEKIDKSLYPLKSISKRSLNLSSYLLHDIVKNDDQYELPTHRNEFAKICENLLFTETDATNDTTEIDDLKSNKKNENKNLRINNDNNTFKKMTLDPKLKKATLKNLATFLPTNTTNNINSNDTRTKLNDFNFKQSTVNRNKHKKGLGNGLIEDSIKSESKSPKTVVERPVSNYIPQDNKSFDIGKEKSNLPLNDLRTTSTFNDLNIILNSDLFSEGFVNKEEPRKSTNEPFSNVKKQITETKQKTKLPKTKSFLFADLETNSSYTLKNLEHVQKLESLDESTSSGFIKAKRKVILTTTSSDTNMNSSNEQKVQNNYHDDDRVHDYRGSLYVSNKPDFDEISLSDINTSVNRLNSGDGSFDNNLQLAVSPFDINDLKLSPEKQKKKPLDEFALKTNAQQRSSYINQYTDTNEYVKRDSTYHNRDSRLLEITIGDITNENFNDVDMKNDNTVDEEQKRVTMLFDEDDKKFFEDFQMNRNAETNLQKNTVSTNDKNLSNLKKNLLLETNKKSNAVSIRKQNNSDDKRESAITSNHNEKKLNIPKLRNKKEKKMYTIEPKSKTGSSSSSSSKNWFIRLVSRISSNSSHGSSKSVSPEFKNDSSEEEEENRIKSRNKSSSATKKNERELQTTKILHERLFNNKNLFELDEISDSITNELNSMKSKYPFFNYNVSNEIPNVLKYNFFYSSKEKIQDSVIDLNIEKNEIDETITVILSQFRNINDSSLEKIQLFNDLSNFILKTI